MHLLQTMCTHPGQADRVEEVSQITPNRGYLRCDDASSSSYAVAVRFVLQ